jgi:hemolysin III
LSNFTKGVKQYALSNQFYANSGFKYTNQARTRKQYRTWFWNYFGVVSIPILIAFAIKSDNTSGIIGAAIYGFCFFTTFTFLHSTMEFSMLSKTLEILDHISIYFLMGTYLRFTYVYANSFGITLLSVLWGLTALGIIYKIFF